MSKERVTVIDIAHAAGVSKSTVSPVLQGSSLVNEATRAKVNAVIRELGYVYNRGAANLRQAKSKIVGIVVNDLTNSFFAELAVGVDMVVQSAGYVQFLSNTGESIDRQREVVAFDARARHFRSDRPAGARYGSGRLQVADQCRHSGGDRRAQYSRRKGLIAGVGQSCRRIGGGRASG